ncbi:MAG: hypothetical protein RL739_1253 [Pseudomonadota bacterium]
MNPILNISAYLFTPLAAPEVWRERCRDQADARQLKGTILLAPEGINLFLAGPEAPVDGFMQWLRAQEGMAGLGGKRSWSAEQPFGKLLVKVKREIIRMNHPTIAPAEGRAPAVSPTDLQRWLAQGHDDQGRAVVMLDTRNAFEVGHGKFAGALDWGLAKFSEFPQAAQDHLGELQGKTVVSYCTGGIRCEKAAIFLRELGLPDVYQLDGGILQYFEDTGGAHFEGDCFVFDERVALAPDLSAKQG